MQPGRLPIPQEETCPIPENLLGQLYRASSHGLDSLIATVPAKTRAMLVRQSTRVPKTSKTSARTATRAD